MTHTQTKAMGRTGALILALGAAAVQASQYECLMEPMQVVELATPVSGLIESVTVKRADRVSTGQVLVTLESKAETAAADLARHKSQASGAMETAASKLEFAQKKFERKRQMAAERLIPAQEADDAQAELGLARAELTSAREAREQGAIEHRQQDSLLQLRSVRSPLDGVVIDQMLYPGEVVEAGGRKAILKLARIDPLRVRVILPIAAFGKPRVGMKATVQPEAPVGGRHRATVVAVDRVLDAASATFIAMLELPNPRHELPAGAKCKAAFDF